MDWLTGNRVAQGTDKRRIAPFPGATKHDRAAVPTLLDAVQGEYFTVRAHAALALRKADHTKARIDEEQR